MALISAPDVAPIPPAAGQGRVLGPSARFAVSRVLSSLGTLVFVILFNFFLFRMLPGDPIALYTRGRDVDPEIRRQMQAKFHAPIADQFIQYIKNPFVPELPSQQFSVPVWDVIVPRIGPTLLLVGTATVLATIFGVWLGIRSAWKRGERFDKVDHDNNSRALLDAGVLVRDDPADRVLGRRARVSRDFSRRRVVHARRRPE